MNIRQSITRNITYSIVTIIDNMVVQEEGKEQPITVMSNYTVYGETTPTKEMKKLLKDFKGSILPTITVETITEKRAISIEDFIAHSIIINENEELTNEEQQELEKQKQEHPMLDNSEQI